MKSQNIAFHFILDYLLSVQPKIKSIFSGHGVYVAEKIVFITRKKDTHMEDNGIWIATNNETLDSLKIEFPSLRIIKMFGKENSQWQVIPEDAEDFESSALHLCDLIVRGDRRIGKITEGSKKVGVKTKKAEEKSKKAKIRRKQ